MSLEHPSTEAPINKKEGGEQDGYVEYLRSRRGVLSKESAMRAWDNAKERNSVKVMDRAVEMMEDKGFLFSRIALGEAEGTVLEGHYPMSDETKAAIEQIGVTVDRTSDDSVRMTFFGKEDLSDLVEVNHTVRAIAELLPETRGESEEGKNGDSQEVKERLRDLPGGRAIEGLLNEERMLIRELSPDAYHQIVEKAELSQEDLNLLERDHGFFGQFSIADSESESLQTIKSKVLEAEKAVSY